MSKKCVTAPCFVPVARISTMYSAFWSPKCRAILAAAAALSAARYASGETKDGASYGGDGLRGQARLCDLSAWMLCPSQQHLPGDELGYRLKGARTICRSGAAQPCNIRLPQMLTTGDETRMDCASCTKLKPLEIPYDV
jgi:hypothetical protein